jgi:glucose/arabinose dehydrogenase
MKPFEKPGSFGFLLLIVTVVLAASSRLPGQSVPPGFSIDQILAGGLVAPTDFAFLGDGRLLVCEKNSGLIRLIRPGVANPITPVASLMDLETFGERGLISLECDPDFATNGYVYVLSTRSVSGFSALRLSRLQLAGDLSDGASSNLTFVTGSEMTLFQLFDAQPIHNGGSIRFGIDGALYMSVGDDGIPGNSASIDDGLGVLLRLDVSGVGSVAPAGPEDLVPSDNPLVGATDPLERLALAKGLRNPFTLTIDSQNGDIYIGDVGEALREEINHYPYPQAGAFPVLDYGWPWRQGELAGPGIPGQSSPGGFVEPIDTRIYGQEGFAIMAGVLYRPTGGTSDLGPEFDGRLLHGDWSTGSLIWLERDPATGAWSRIAPVSGQPAPNYWGVGFNGAVRYRIGPEGGIWFLDHFLGRIGRIISDVDAGVLEVASGTNQVGVKGEGFQLPVVFELCDSAGAPLAGVTLNLTVSGNGSLVTPGPYVTDAAGQVSADVSAVDAGEITVQASRSNFPTVEAEVQLFARGLDISILNFGSFDVLVCEFINSSFGTNPVPFYFGASGSLAPVYPTPYGLLVIDVISQIDTVTIEDPFGLTTGTQVRGGFGDPGKTNIYTIPTGLLLGTTRFQCVWLDPSTPTSIAGIGPSAIALSNQVNPAP